MKILGFNRVELIVREDQIHDAIAQFNALLGLNLHAGPEAPDLRCVSQPRMRG